METRSMLKEINSHLEFVSKGQLIQYSKQSVIDIWMGMPFGSVCKYTTCTCNFLISTIYSINSSLIASDILQTQYGDSPVKANRELSESFEILWNVRDNYSKIEQEIGFNIEIGKLECLNILKIKKEVLANQHYFIDIIQQAYPSFLNGSSYLLQEADYQHLFISKLINNWGKFELCLSLLYENFMLRAYQDKMIEQYNSTIKSLIQEISEIEDEHTTKRNKQKKSKAKRSLNKKINVFKEKIAAGLIQKAYKRHIALKPITMDKLAIKSFVIKFSSDQDTCLEDEEEDAEVGSDGCSSCDETNKVLQEQYKRADYILQDHAYRWEYIDYMRRLCLLPIVKTYYKPESVKADAISFPIIESYYGPEAVNNYYYTPEEYKTSIE